VWLCEVLREHAEIAYRACATCVVERRRRRGAAGEIASHGAQPAHTGGCAHVGANPSCPDSAWGVDRKG
jgi:hypothetical protein